MKILRHKITKQWLQYWEEDGDFMVSEIPTLFNSNTTIESLFGDDNNEDYSLRKIGFKVDDVELINVSIIESA